MERKPIVIYVILILFCLTPWIFVCISSVTHEVSILEVAKYHYTRNSFYTFQFYFLIPLLGVAVFNVKKWSVYAFVILEVWIFIFYLEFLKVFFQDNNVAWLIVSFTFYFVQASFVLYFLISSLKKVYLDPATRWWQAEPRYKIDLTCSIDDNKSCKVLNISRTGLFVCTELELKSGENCQLKFRADEKDICVKCLVIHQFEIDGNRGYGCKYVKDDKQVMNDLKHYLKDLNRKRVERRPDYSNPIFEALDLISRL